MLNSQNLVGQNRGILVILLKAALQNNIYHIFFGMKLQKYPHSTPSYSDHMSIPFV